MKVTADTNVLVRAIIADEPAQADLAQAALADAELVVVTLPALCEFVWVLTSRYKTATTRIALAIRALIASPKVVINRRAVEAGLAMLEAGGDFADGVIAFEGALLDGETFLSFDTKAVALIEARGGSAHLLG